MNAMKNSIPLFGARPLPSWVVTYSDIPFTPDLVAENWISGVEHPTLFSDQIPKRMLEKDPGFFIFCRDHVPDQMPPWVLSKDPENLLKGRGFYQLRQKQLAEDLPELIYFDRAHVEEAHLISTPKTFWYCDDHLESLQGKRINPYEDLFRKHLFRYNLIDLQIGGLSYLHYTCLFRGGKIRFEIPLVERNPTLSIPRWYGTWEIFLPENP